jgi:Domain of unknown function (DUF2017)
VTAFRRTKHGVVVSFDEVEASLLRHLVSEVRVLLEADSEAGPEDGLRDRPDDRPQQGPAVADADAELAELTRFGDAELERPDDPVLARLLPDGYRDDPDAAGEFRRLTESSLRRGKRAAADALLADLPESGGGEVRLDAETTERWLTVLNDVRLALGTRLDVAEDMPEPDPDDPDAPAYVVYLWLTELQGVLIEVAADPD